MRVYSIIVIAVFVTLTAWSVYRYIETLKQQTALMQAIADVKNTLVTVENDKRRLQVSLEQSKQAETASQKENIALKENLKGTEDRLNKLEAEFKGVKESIDKLSALNTALTAENAALREQRDNLDIQVYQLSEENENLRMRMQSVAELKKAIRDLQKREGKPSIYGTLSAENRKVRLEADADGNSGFIVKEGQPTYSSSSKVKIEVEPVSYIE